MASKRYSGPADLRGTKVCIKCGEEKARENFYVDRAFAGLTPRQCIECIQGANRAYKEAKLAEPGGRELFSAQSRNSRLIREYGITTAEWIVLFVSQGERCAICRDGDPRNTNGWQTDHCHETMRVRGILCHPCNTTLGFHEAGWSLPGFPELVEKYLKGGE